MKKWKRLLVSLLTVSMTLGASTMSVMADDTTPYTYKVTLSAGNKGTINGQNKIEKSDISYGSKFSFDNTDLRQVMQDIGSWYNISIAFRSRPLLDERIYFHINRQLPVNTVLDALNDLKIAQFTMKEGKIIVETPQDKKR